MSNKRKSNNNLILCKQDLVLLHKSEEVKNTEIYGNLYECLKPYETLSPKDLESDIVFDDKARMVLTHDVKRMMDHIKEEWYAKTSFETATTEVHCQLCGTKNKYVCYITNRINGEELNVGRECVKKYKTINGANIILSKLNSHLRDTTKDARRSSFDTALEDDISFTKIAENRIETFPIVIPYKLYNDLKTIIVTCNRIRTTYISSGSDFEESIAKFKLKIEEFEKLYKQAESHYQQNVNDPLICTREISNWLKSNYPTIVVDVQKSKGFLNEKTLQFVHEPNFIKNNLDNFKKCLKDKDVTILSVNGNVIRFKIKNSRFIQPIYFTMPIKNFMMNIGCHCLTQVGYRFDKLNLSPSIENNSSNFKKVLNYFVSVLSNTSYTIILEERTSQLYWEKKQSITLQWSNRTRNIEPIYKIATIEKIFSIMSNILLNDNLSERGISKSITSKIEMSGKWITKEEKDRNVQIASEAAGIQKQKEFIPYA